MRKKLEEGTSVEDIIKIVKNSFYPEVNVDEKQFNRVYDNRSQKVLINEQDYKTIKNYIAKLFHPDSQKSSLRNQHIDNKYSIFHKLSEINATAKSDPTKARRLLTDLYLLLKKIEHEEHINFNLPEISME